MADNREGPRVRFAANCQGCVHCRSEYYVCQSDTGYSVSCAHPDTPKSIGLGWKTPEWCSLLGAAIDRLMSITRGEGGR